ncbi:alanine racemase [Cohnella sp. JJ-181]|uniref:alanine racemase n=1 Tax=Cohnella rhizoplanae TaxID=2974897 RepID=UPI0022FF78F2|nr:alanine racemase [Cohnella sp. JJ-181]CAI6034223.1 Alanine racemase 2 [Cohnella sp. JJ-181]
MTRLSYRDTWAEVSLGAIAHNVGVFKQHLGKSARLMAVVKADGYGHGAVETAGAAIQAGADQLGVAFLDEALQLRDAGVEHPILVLGHTPGHALEAAIRHRVTIAVSSLQLWDDAARAARRVGIPARIHLKVDTGMARLGFTPEEVLPACLGRSREPVILEGIFTHFADADRPDPTFTRGQYAAFAALVSRLADHGIHIPVKHCCNSAAAMRYPEMRMDMARIGIAMYGLSPLQGEASPSFPLREAMQLKTAVSHLKTVPPHTPVSYGLTYTTKKESLIATLPIGYADGLSRQLSNQGWVLIRGKRVPIVGRICMDQTMVDVSSIPDARIGEEVTVFGESAGERLSINEVASLMHTIPYETVCLIGKRVPRVYAKIGETSTLPTRTDPSTSISVPSH